MANITIRDPDRNRGQLLIITALALAVMLTLMALALNTAVFGEVYAAQTDESLREERGALQYEDAVQRSVQGLIQGLNDQQSTYTALETGLDSGLKNWSTLAEQEYAREDAATNASLDVVTFETTIIQNDSQDFTDHSNNKSWTVAENVSTVEAYEMNVSKNGLSNSSNCLNDSSCFTLTVESDDETWMMLVNRSQTANIEFTVTSSTGTDTCITDKSPVTVNVTAGVLDPDDAECAFTSFLDDPDVTAPYTVKYSNADKINGTYELTVPKRVTNSSIEDDGRYETSSSPWLDPRITGANISVRYRSIDLIYRTSFRVTAGGET